MTGTAHAFDPDFLLDRETVREFTDRAKARINDPFIGLELCGCGHTRSQHYAGGLNCHHARCECGGFKFGGTK